MRGTYSDAPFASSDLLENPHFRKTAKMLVIFLHQTARDCKIISPTKLLLFVCDLTGRTTDFKQ
ncbi:hypothetical protein BKI51_24235 [Alphaproteobacteria bacterium AO1-B]|nr:hypothetical protein BKI51_24235 [Alphaproteobacteria bacterium AO1-B]